MLPYMLLLMCLRRYDISLAATMIFAAADITDASRHAAFAGARHTLLIHDAAFR